MAGSFTSIELRHLRYFVAAAEHGSFRKAGSALGVRESTISRRVRDLEDEIGASLFQRHSSGVELTLAGQELLGRARGALRTIQEGATGVASIGRSERGRVRVGVYSSLASGFLNNLFRSYYSLHEGVEVEFVEGNPAEHVVSIRQLKLDIAFLTGTGNHADCDTICLWQERVFVAMPEDHLLNRKADIVWGDLTQERFIVSHAAPGQEIYDFLGSKPNHGLERDRLS